MGQFDNFKNIAILLTGAFLVSFGIINFLNIEIESRSNHGVKMRNENLFEVLARKINEMLTTLREKNSHRRSLLYHLFTQENTTRSSMRKLHYFRKNRTSGAQNVEHDSYQTHHRLRHGKKMKALTELFVKDKNNSALSNMVFSFDAGDRYGDNGGFVTVSNIVNNKRTVLVNSDISKDMLEEGLKAHEHCYTTNDVLEIIAITCLVNFIFWFLIIFCVNVFTRNKKLWKFNSFESLTSIVSESEFELDQAEPKTGADFRAENHRNFFRNYLNSLTNELEGCCPENELRDSYSLEENPSEKKSNFGKCHQRFIHLSSIYFDSVSPDNSKPDKKKSLVSWRNSNKIIKLIRMFGISEVSYISNEHEGRNCAPKKIFLDLSRRFNRDRFKKKKPDHENPLKLWDKKIRNGQIKRNVSDDVKGLILEMNSKMPMNCYINCPLSIKQTLGIQYPFFHMVVKLPISTFFAFDVQVLDDKSIRRRLRVSTVQTFVDIHPFMCKLPLTLENGWNRVTLPLHYFLKDIYGTVYLQTLRVAVYSNCALKKIYFSDKEYLEEDLPTEFHIEDPDLSENYRLKYTAMVTQKRKNALSYYPDLISTNKRTSCLLRNKIL